MELQAAEKKYGPKFAFYKTKSIRGALFPWQHHWRCRSDYCILFGDYNKATIFTVWVLDADVKLSHVVFLGVASMGYQPGISETKATSSGAKWDGLFRAGRLR